MTNEDVKNGFNEVHNKFWSKYRDHIPDRTSDEWERIHTWAAVLKKKYPFLEETVVQLELELDQRMRRGEGNGVVSGSKSR